jgi:hypothetical protein
MWDEIMDMPGEIFDIEQAREDIKQERLAREESEEFLDLCIQLMFEGEVDEDAIEAEAHKLLDEMNR